MKDDRVIVITTLPIACDRQEVFKMSQRDRSLINSICRYADKLRKEDKEVFARKNNIIATESGYFLALYEDELQQLDVKEEKEQQFIGEDGRMKVRLMDKDQKEVIADIANMVAQAYVPNPFNHKYVKFKDGNKINCNKSNLYWSDTE